MPTGIVTAINRQKQSGTIRGDDGRTLSFEREAMVLYLEFEQLKAGDTVQFDVEGERTATNVERVQR